MGDDSEEILKAVCEIRDLVRLMAEPSIAQRDEKLRSQLRQVVGKSEARAKAVLLMNGSRAQSEIQRETEINQGNLSTLVKQLSEGGLLSENGKKPKLAISIPTNFFEVDIDNG